MYVTKKVTVTTDGSGDAEEYSDVVSGELLDIEYIKTDFADGVDFAITLERTGRGIWTESNVNATARRAPGQDTHDELGVVAQENGALIPVVNDRFKIVISSGGDTKTGTFYFNLKTR